MEKLEEFSEWDENRKWWALRSSDKSSVIEKWKSHGFLDSVGEEISDDMALSLETMVMFILNRVTIDRTRTDGLIETMIFPIMIRVFRELPELMCHDYVSIIYNIAVNRIPEVYKEVGEINGEGVDWEAEICRIIADEIIAQFTKNQTGQN